MVMPTPIQSAIQRYSRAVDSSEKVLSFQYLLETSIKLLTISLLAILRTKKPQEICLIEHHVANSSVLGDWVARLRALHKLSGECKDSDPWLTEVSVWGRRKLSSSESDAAKRIIQITQCQVETPSNPLSLMDVLVTVRNRTVGHGAPTPTVIREIGNLLPVLTDAIANKDVLSKIVLCWRLPTDFDPVFRVLEGEIPSRHRVMTGLELCPHPQGKKVAYLLLGDEPDQAFELPPFLEYIDEKPAVYFLNKKRNSGGQSEFLNYFTGEFITKPCIGYEHEPIRPKSEVGIVPTYSQDGEDKVYGYQRINPDLLFSEKIPRAEWMNVPFDEASQNALPSEKKGGVYAFISKVNSGGLPEHSIIGYVGKTGDISRRFSEYIKERTQGAGGRPKVVEFFRRFKNIHFYFTYVPADDARENLETWLIKSIDPPACTEKRVKLGLTFDQFANQPAW